MISRLRVPALSLYLSIFPKMPMTTFKEYLLTEDILQTKRQGIIHLQDMKPLEFLVFAHEIQNTFKGKLSNLDIDLKVDGCGWRFGKDSKGNFFAETSNSGAIQKAKAFSAFTAAKGANEVSITRALHYDDIYDVLEASNLWKDFPNDTKIVIEIMYNPMSEESEDGLKFVSVKYDKDKLGSLMTIVPISATVASSGERHAEEKEIIDSLLKKSTSKIKVVSPKLGKLSLDIKAELEPLQLLGPDAEHVIKSLKHADKPKKQEYIAILNAIKAEIADKILQHPIKGKDVLGTEIEGVIIEWNGRLFKITTPDFKSAKRADKASHKPISEGLSC